MTQQTRGNQGDTANNRHQFSGGRSNEPPRNETNNQQEPNANQNNNENWVTVHENPGFSLEHNQASNDERPRTVQVNHVLAETSREPNNNPRNESEIEEEFRYAEKIWPKHVVRW